MTKNFIFFLTTSPYSSENTRTSIKIIEAVISKGHSARLIASGDGVYCFLKGQKAKGITNAEEKFSELLRKGLKVYL